MRRDKRSKKHPHYGKPSLGGFMTRTIYFLIGLTALVSLSLCSCDEGATKRSSGKKDNAGTVTPTDTNTDDGSDQTEIVSGTALNCEAFPRAAKLNIHQKYCAFSREIWIEFKDKYFRADGQHVDRWQEQGGPELWHIPDGGVMQGMLLGAYVLEYSWTKSSASLEKVKFLMNGMDTLEKVTGVPGLIARVAVKKDGRTPPDWLYNQDMVYKDSALADYVHRADVSGDQYSGLAWGLAVAAKHGPPEVSAWASAYAKRVVKYLEANEWRLVVDGKVTEHGDMAPEDTPAGAVGDFLGVLNGMHIAKILAFFKIANLNSPDASITASEKTFVDKYYGKGLFEVSLGTLLKKSDNVFQVSSNFQAYLTVAPEDATYRKLFKDFIIPNNYAQRVAFDDFALSYHEKQDISLEQTSDAKLSAIEALETFPWPKVIRNSGEERFTPDSTTPLPVSERVVNSWTWGENPFIKGKEPTAEALAGKHRFSPIDYIVVYNMGRAYGIITE